MADKVTEKVAEKVEEQKSPELVVLEKIYDSLDDMLNDGVGETEYAVIEGYVEGTKIRIGSVTAGDMVEFAEENEGDPKKRRVAGLRLICKSLVGPEPNNRRYAADPHLIDANVKKLMKFQHKHTNRVVDEILKLNKMEVKKDKEAKND